MFRAPPPGSDHGALAREADERVRAAIQELPDGYREAVVLVDLEGLGYPEAAKLLGLHINAFKTRLHRARMFLRNRLEAFWIEREGGPAEAPPRRTVHGSGA